MKANKLKIHGLVQGVFFRKNTHQQALKHGVSGYVKNCADGTVEVFVEGSEEKVEDSLLLILHAKYTERELFTLTDRKERRIAEGQVPKLRLVVNL